MKNNPSEPLVTTEDRYAEVSLELAFFRLLQTEVQDARSKCRDHEAVILEAAQNSKERNLRIIDQMISRKRHGVAQKKHAAFILKLAVVFIAAASMVFSLTFATNRQFRLKVYAWEAKNEDGSENISLSDTDQSVEVPDNWREDYFPAGIPAGWDMINSESTEGYSSVLYENTAGDILKIEIIGPGGKFQINTDDAWINYIHIQGSYATVYHHRNGMIEIVWFSGKNMFVITSSDQSTAYQVAESMSLVRK